MSKKVLIIAIGGLMSLFSCKNEEASKAVKRYCECLENNVNNDVGRLKCIDLMDSLQHAFAGQPRVMNQIVEETKECQLSF